MDAEKTGKLIRELRTEKKMTQQELASLLSVSPTAVSKWENGKRLPDISMLEPLVKALDVTFAEIILGERNDSTVSPVESAEKEERGAEMTENEERTEAAIKSVIDESLSQKKTNARWTIRIIAAVMVFLAAALIGVSWYRAHHTKYGYSLDITRLERVNGMDPEAPFSFGGKQYVPYRLVQRARFDELLKNLNISSPEELGTVVAFRTSLDGGECFYFCTVDALEGDWLLMFKDDRTGGVPSADNALYLCTTNESLSKTPDWMRVEE